MAQTLDVADSAPGDDFGPSIDNPQRPTGVLKRNPAQLRQKRINAVMWWLRKIHLYSGIFMFPWVMIYGVSALLFNHNTLFSDNPVTQTFGPETVQGTPFTSLPSPESLANEVVASMTTAGAEQGNKSEVKLISPESARFARSQATINTTKDQERFTVALDMSGQGGIVRSRREEVAPAALPENRPTFATTDLEIETPAAAKVREAASTILARINVPASDNMTVTLPDLTFQVEADGRPWNVTYNFERRSATARPAGVAASTLTTRNYLLRLHLVHGYPEYFSAKTLWCIAVDAMFASMVFWGVSGVLMWWQLKATRSLGIVFAVLSAVTATVLMVGMHQEFVSSPGRGEGGGGGGGGPGGARPAATSDSLGRGGRGGEGRRGGSRGEAGPDRGAGDAPDGAPSGERGSRGRGPRGGAPSESGADHSHSHD